MYVYISEKSNKLLFSLKYIRMIYEKKKCLFKIIEIKDEQKSKKATTNLKIA